MPWTPKSVATEVIETSAEHCAGAASSTTETIKGAAGTVSAVASGIPDRIKNRINAKEESN